MDTLLVRCVDGEDIKIMIIGGINICSAELTVSISLVEKCQFLN